MRGVIISIKLDKNKGIIEEEIDKALDATHIRKTTQESGAYTLGSVYAGLIPKNNLLNIISRVAGKVLKICGLYTKARFKHFVLALYGFYDIKDFVSDRVMNTFKWLPDRTDIDKKFRRYQTFILKAYKKPRLEIEIRNESR